MSRATTGTSGRKVNAAEGFAIAAVNDFDKAQLTDPQKQFLTGYQELYKAEPDWAATHGADAAMVLVAVLQSGARDGESVKRMLDQKRSFEGVNTGLTFDDNGDVINKPIVVKIVNNGKFEVAK